MNADLFELFAKDLISLLKEKAMNSKFDRAASIGGADEDFNSGRLMAFYDVVSLARDQAIAFDIELARLGLEDFEPERDLLN